MKARFIFAAMAALAIVSCNKNSVEPQVPSLDGPSAMLKVNIKAADGMTKAFSAGTAEENAVSKVDFYFYDSAGKAYSVVTGSNAITWTAETPGTSTNIEKVSDLCMFDFNAGGEAYREKFLIMENGSPFTFPIKGGYFHIAGLLGTPFLRKYGAVMDFSDNSLIFNKSNTDNQL